MSIVLYFVLLFVGGSLVVSFLVPFHYWSWWTWDPFQISFNPLHDTRSCDTTTTLFAFFSHIICNLFWHTRARTLCYTMIGTSGWWPSTRTWWTTSPSTSPGKYIYYIIIFALIYCCIYNSYTLNTNVAYQFSGMSTRNGGLFYLSEFYRFAIPNVALGWTTFSLSHAFFLIFPPNCTKPNHTGSFKSTQRTTRLRWPRPGDSRPPWTCTSTNKTTFATRSSPPP